MTYGDGFRNTTLASQASAIAQTMEDDFASQNYDGAVTTCARNVANTIADIYGVSLSGSTTSNVAGGNYNYTDNYYEAPVAKPAFWETAVDGLFTILAYGIVILPCSSCSWFLSATLQAGTGARSAGLAGGTAVVPAARRMMISAPVRVVSMAPWPAWPQRPARPPRGGGFGGPGMGGGSFGGMGGGRSGGSFRSGGGGSFHPVAAAASTAAAVDADAKTILKNLHRCAVLHSQFFGSLYLVPKMRSPASPRPGTI